MMASLEYVPTNKCVQMQMGVSCDLFSLPHEKCVSGQMENHEHVKRQKFVVILMRVFLENIRLRMGWFVQRCKTQHP